ncbi:hypothetical protein [Mycetohabitans sp. B46]|uniref:hypothetical protein n=1 Tax=Mycetohabitans sp. B46 TaxID=2772536 RepID=UPI00307F3927
MSWMNKAGDLVNHGGQAFNNAETASSLTNSTKQTEAMSNLATALNVELQGTLTRNNLIDKCASGLKEQVQAQR